jgi:hypothetical protein
MFLDLVVGVYGEGNGIRHRVDLKPVCAIDRHVGSRDITKNKRYKIKQFGKKRGIKEL